MSEYKRIESFAQRDVERLRPIARPLGYTVKFERGLFLLTNHETGESAGAFSSYEETLAALLIMAEWAKPK